MKASIDVRRKLVELTFSRDFEAILLAYPTRHLSLTHDLELAVQRGLLALEELEDVHDLEHIDLIRDLIAQTNKLTVMDAVYFTHWKLTISEDILDEIDLLLLAHGNDLTGLGLKKTTEATLIILLAVAGCRK